MEKNSPPPIPQVKRKRGCLKSVLYIFLGFVLLLFTLAVVGRIFQALDLSGNNEKIAVVKALSDLHYPEDISKAQSLCTAKGISLLQDIAVPDGRFFPATYEVVEAKTSGIICDILMSRDLADGYSEISVRLVNQNGWKFDDVFLINIRGRKFGLWLTYLRDHPLLSLGQVYSPEIKSGISQVKGFIDFLEQMKRIGDEDKSNARNKNVSSEEQSENLRRLLEAINAKEEH